MAKTKLESQEDVLDEARETPQQQAQERREGTEEHSTIPLPEEFQMQVLDLLKDATDQQVDFIQDLCRVRSQELLDEKKEKEKEENPEAVDMNDYEIAKGMTSERY